MSNEEAHQLIFNLGFVITEVITAGGGIEEPISSRDLLTGTSFENMSDATLKMLAFKASAREPLK